MYACVQSYDTGRAIIRPNYTGGHNGSLDIIKRDYGDQRSVRVKVSRVSPKCSLDATRRDLKRGSNREDGDRSGLVTCHQRK
jgi:hypothetical protein